MPPLQPPQVEDLAGILAKCKKERNLAHVLRLHAHMRESGLESHPSLGNCLVSMLVEVGSMCDAQQVFDKLVYRDECSWNSLITGYVKCGESQYALTLYQKMQEDDSLHPSGCTFVALLKACTMLKDLERGHKIHSEIVRKGLLKRNIFIGSSLVDMYAKCGSLARAQEVFDELPARDIVLWTVLIGGYAEHGLGEEALRCLEQMQYVGVPPDAATLVCSLKACGSIGATIKGQEIHDEIAKKGFLEKNLVVGSTLVDMYAKSGMLAEAREVFDKLPMRDVVSWTALMAGYAEHGRGDEALNYFKQMQHDGVSPTAVTFVCSLKACGSIGAASMGQELHAEVSKKGFLERNIFVGSALVDMYAKCGSLAKAQEVFDKLSIRNVVSWNALITGYTEHGHGEEALNCFEQMQRGGISPDSVTLVCSLKACGSIGAIDKGREMHAEIIGKSLERDLVTGNTLVDMFAKCGSLVEAQDVFDKLPVQNVVSCTALIAGYAEHGHAEEALHCFKQMQQEGISPNAATFVCSLKACGITETVNKGQEIHAEIARIGLERELLVGNTLVDMYGKCGLFAEAQEVFDMLPVRDVISWNALIAGFIEHGCGEEALNCFEQMQHESVSPDAITFVYCLKACGSKGAIDKGREIHAEVIKQSLPERDVSIGSALVDMYAKSGLLAEAQKVFDKLLVQSVVSWNAVIAGYAEHGHGEEALNCYEQMQHEGTSPDPITLVCSLKACGSIGARAKGQEIHVDMAKKGLEREPLVGNTLVFMYAKCGLLSTAQKVFDKLSVRNVVSWTALMAGYAQLGESEDVFHIFDKMIGEGIKPDLVTFGSVLSACSHAGLVDKGQMYFEAITNDHGLIPTLEHYICMIDLLGRAGHIDKAIATIKKMPFHPGIVVWHIVLGACRKWRNVELARHAFEHALRLDEQDASAYVCMSNIYRDAAMQEDANKVEAMRLEKQAWQKPGNSWWTDPGETVHSFLVGVSHSKSCMQS